MKLNVQVTEQDYVRGWYLNMRPKKWITVLGIIMVLLMVFTFVESLYEMISKHESSDTVFILAIVGIYFIAFFLYLLPRKFRKLYRQWKYLPACDCEIGDEGISIVNSLGNSKIPWDYWRKWRENKYIFILYPVDNLFNVWPKRCFSSEQDINDFRKLLIEKIGQEK
jgi:hypothetical protein